MINLSYSVFTKSLNDEKNVLYSHHVSAGAETGSNRMLMIIFYSNRSDKRCKTSGEEV